ncbi:MAG: hypothetical protein ACKO96_19585, partial [Flammeovirgaceae bacterium]
TQEIQALGENYVNRLNHNLVSNLRFSNSEIFKVEKNSSEEILESGDFYIDYENGVVFSNDLQSGFANYIASNFPFILWWQPVKVFELNDSDIDLLIKDRLLVDEG